MKYMFVLAALCLTACSNYEFKSNLNPSNFREYFKPSAVTEYTEEELANIFVQIYLDGKCCLKDLEKMMAAIGYKLTDEFYKKINIAERK